MTHVDDWLEKAFLLNMPSEISWWAVTWFPLANKVIRPPLWLWLSHQNTVPHVCIPVLNHLHTMWQERGRILLKWKLKWSELWNDVVHLPIWWYMVRQACGVLFFMCEWSLSYTLSSLWYIYWSTFPSCCQVHICTTGLIVTPPPSSPVTTATVFTFPSETSYTSITVVGGILYRSNKSCKHQAPEQQPKYPKPVKHYWSNGFKLSKRLLLEN